MLLKNFKFAKEILLNLIEVVYNQKHIDLLKLGVVKKFGRSIETHKDSKELAVFVKVDNAPVSAQTIRRIFGLIKNEHKPSIPILNALASYVGYENFNHFLSENLESQLEFLFSENVNTQDYWDACEKLSYALLDSPEMVAICQEKLTKLPIAREYFIENHPLRDLVCTGYAMYFQEYLKYKYTNESRLYAYGFLFVGAFLSENKPYIDIYHEQVEKTPLIYPPNGVFHLPAARKFGVSLLHAWLNQDEKRFHEKFNEMLSVRPLYEYSSKYHAFSFDQEMIEHLVLTDRFHEMRMIIDTTVPQVNPDVTSSSRQTSHQETWKILKAYVYLNTGERKLAENYYKAVNLSLINPGWQKYYTILYYFVKYHFSSIRKKKEVLKKIEELIDITHFTFYHRWIKELK
ncbi:hypothetical protein Ornrh_1784 [Ornithobacterium rhinotracheale DSM 15997]|uniref:Uncharacterized protein n=1 Tax=Ornithobacterium rhinotracheale (strain ATCC 51463 / DSM 15997 / CCUG 23171 / CIP 104009 / LMG 9086) TaxID=867902 RepID=I4A1V0_ORNRL|nr:hypothetical protein Ornrh_1784 [Ornithobacterium rhinotracheale DSM 15997]